MNRTLSPVPIRTMEIKRNGTSIDYPQIGPVTHVYVQQSINEAIVHLVESLIAAQQEKQGVHSFTEMIGLFEIKTNERNILSLTLSNYAYAYPHANGLTVMGSLTFDVETGRQYELNDLFLPGSPYIERLSTLVKQQITERDIPVIGEFSSISPQQEFYIADKALVLYFQSIEITPHYVGIPMFPISVYQLEDIINPEGPLGRMLPA